MYRNVFSLIILLSLYSFGGCKPDHNLSETNKEIEDFTSEKQDTENMELVSTEVDDITLTVEFVEIEDAELWLKNNQFTFQLNPDEMEVLENAEIIETNEDAIKVGVDLIEVSYKNGKYLDHTSLTIYRSTEDNIWIFSYNLEQREELVEYGGFYIAVDGSTASLIEAWAEE